MNETVWAELQEQRKNLQPTPPIGEPLVWYIAGDVTRPCAAVCNAIEDHDGRLYVTIHTKGGMVMHRGACYHISHPIHQKRTQTTANNGAWDYPRGKAPKADYDRHLAEIERREAGLIAAEEQIKKSQEAFLQKAAERAAEKAGPKKRLPEPIAAPTF
jgi:hypothetical protein